MNIILTQKRKGIFDICVTVAELKRSKPRRISRNIEKPRDKSPDPCYIKFMKYSTEKAEVSSPCRTSDGLLMCSFLGRIATMRQMIQTLLVNKETAWSV